MPEGTDTLIERSKLDYSAIIFMFFSDSSQISDFFDFQRKYHGLLAAPDYVTGQSRKCVVLWILGPSSIHG